MAVAAYASLLSLTHVLGNLHYRAPFHLPLLDIKLVESLQQNVQYLLDFVQLHSEMESSEIECSWRHMAEVANEAEEMIDFHVVNLLYLRTLGETGAGEISTFCVDLERIISKIDVIKKDLPEIHHEACKEKSATTVLAPPSTTYSSGKNVVVGFDGHMVRIKDQLTSDRGNLQVLPIVGMGGIGKTTLARCIYDDPYIVSYFDRRIWLTISQDFRIQEILMGLLASGEYKENHESSANELGDKLYKQLFGRRYLIIMDDMWSTEAWDELKRYFPDNRNSSCVLLTTRQLDVAESLGSFEPYPLSFLDHDNSWNLLCQITFAPTGICPCAELEQIGREIAKSCGGLPLEISVIGSLLANSDMTSKYWRIVVENINSFGNIEDGEHCMKVLSLSYKSMPINLKACFLYLRVFREDDDIYINELVNRWLAEGLVMPESDKSLEEIGMQYVGDLINKNLIFVRGFRQNFIYCGIHDLLRDFCVRESSKEGMKEFPKVIMELPNGMMHEPSGQHICCFCGKPLMRIDDGIHICERAICFPPSSQDEGPFACDVCERKYSHIARIKLVMAMKFRRGETLYPLELPTELRALRFLNRARNFQMVHLLWNLQTIIIPHISHMILPPEFWEMPQLRDIMICRKASLPDPAASHIKGKDFIVLKNLQTLGYIRNFECTQEVVDRVPNLNVLWIRYANDGSKDTSTNESHFSLCNLVQFQKLASLWVKDARENITFSSSLKELILINCQMAWEDMSMIGSLPVLEVLELHGRAIKGSEWNPVEGEFVVLKSLEIVSTRLKCWRADPIHFPILESLRLRDLGSLKEIPLGIGDIPTLRKISVSDCNESVIESAMRIMEDQDEMGNETLQIFMEGVYEPFKFEPLSTEDDSDY